MIVKIYLFTGNGGKKFMSYLPYSQKIVSQPNFVHRQISKQSPGQCFYRLINPLRIDAPIIRTNVLKKIIFFN